MSLPLLNSPAEVLGQLLVQLGQGGDASADPVPEWAVYVAGEPDTPDSVLTIYNTTPKSDGRAMIDGETFWHWGCQIKVRSQDQPTGYAKVQTIKVALDEEVNGVSVTIAPNTYTVYAVSGTSIMDLGKEKPKAIRNVFTLNCLIAMRRIS